MVLLTNIPFVAMNTGAAPPPEAFRVPDVIDKLVPRARLPKVVVPEA